MGKLLKKGTSLALAAILTAGVLGTSAVADTISTIETTYAFTKGEEQSIKITAEGYMKYHVPTPSVEIFFYGVKAYTPGYGNNNTITTSFNIDGKLRTSNSSTPFSKSGNGEICAYLSNGTETLYQSVGSTITTSSSVYGSSSQECNYNCR